MSSLQPIHVLMIEDHPDYRKVISLGMETEEDIDIVNTFGTAERALRSMDYQREQPSPDVILLDLNLPGMSGLDALPWLRKSKPAAKVIVLSQSDQEEDILEAISAGAAGYLLKSASLDEITEAIRTVHSGGASLDSGVAKFILDKMQKKTPTCKFRDLSSRELEILTLLGEGLLKKEIADHLKISTATVATHVRNMYDKLEVQNAPAAISKAYQAGILPEDKAD